MCVYSAYVSEVNKQWPGMVGPWNPSPFMPGIAGSPLMTPTTDPRILQEILDIGKRLDRIDKALGLKDCTQEAAAKKAFEDRLTKLIADAQALKKSVECESVKSDSSAGLSQQQLTITPNATSYVVGSQSTSQAGITLGNGSTEQAKINYRG